MNNTTRPVTIEDVARVAGVSRQTVSRAMNDKDEISPATKEKVLAAIEKLGYRPNRLAQGMVTQRTGTVGLVVPDITNLFFPEVARGVQDAGRLHDYNVLLCNTDDDPREEMKTLRSLAAQRVDGIIMISSCADAAELASFIESYAPLVILNRRIEHPHVSSIMVDNMRGGFLATEHLISLGRRTVGMIASKAYKHSRMRRVEGYRQALLHYSLTPDDNLIVGGDATLKGGYDAMRQLAAQAQEVTAVFAYNDLIGLGAIRACHDLGKRVPADVAVIGFDDIGMAAMSNPSLSSIRIDKYDLGRRAMQRLLDMLDNPGIAYDTVYLDVELVPRESTTG